MVETAARARGSVNDGEQRRGFAHSSQLITRRYAGAYFNPTPVQTIRSGRNRDDISTLVSIISRISKWRFLCRLGGIRHPEALLKQCCNFFSSYWVLVFWLVTSKTHQSKFSGFRILLMWINLDLQSDGSKLCERGGSVPSLSHRWDLDGNQNYKSLHAKALLNFNRSKSNNATNHLKSRLLLDLFKIIRTSYY